MTPPTVSIPKDNGVASIMTKDSVSLLSSPHIIPPYTAAPKATASSGFIPVFTSFPKKSVTSFLILGIRVEPPTSTISSISVFLKPESSKAVYTGPRVFLNKSLFNSSNLALVNSSSKSNPSTKSSISILEDIVLESFLLAFSTSLLSFYIALLSLEMSLLCFFFINLTK